MDIINNILAIGVPFRSCSIATVFRARTHLVPDKLGESRPLEPGLSWCEISFKRRQRSSCLNSRAHCQANDVLNNFLLACFLLNLRKKVCLVKDESILESSCYLQKNSLSGSLNRT